ncbi:unnamed protein product [Coregonus sp. 'balchen']|nr:unnamed protein product [Coregonus sp. 'balchen']
MNTLLLYYALLPAHAYSGDKCPDHIDCARAGRHFCKPGTSYCGPCLNPLDENEEGFGRHDGLRSRDERVETRSKGARTQTEALRMRGQVQPSVGQPTTTQPSTQTPQPATGALGRVGAGGPDGLIAIPYPSKDSLLKESRLAQKVDYPAFGGHGNGTANRTSVKVTSDEEEVDGDFTVYECPGLAPTGEMEVKNPLFNDSTLHYQGNPK